MAKTSTFRGSGVISLARGPEMRRRVYISQHGHCLRRHIRPEASERTDACTLHSGTHLPVQHQMADVQAPAFVQREAGCRETGATCIVDNRCMCSVFKKGMGSPQVCIVAHFLTTVRPPVGLVMC